MRAYRFMCDRKVGMKTCVCRWKGSDIRLGEAKCVAVSPMRFSLLAIQDNGNVLPFYLKVARA